MEIPGNRVSVKGGQNCHSGLVQPHFLSICSVLGTGDPGMYRTQILASGQEGSQC